MESQRERLTLTLSNTTCYPFTFTFTGCSFSVSFAAPPCLPVYIGLSLQNFFPYVFAITLSLTLPSPMASNNIYI